MKPDWDFMATVFLRFDLEASQKDWGDERWHEPALPLPASSLILLSSSTIQVTNVKAGELSPVASGVDSTILTMYGVVRRPRAKIKLRQRNFPFLPVA